MIRSALTLVVALAFTVSARADEKYALTAENTKIEFVGTKKDGKHTGGFKKIDGAITHEGKDWKLTVNIDTTSLFSDDEKLTGHLKSGDFFAVKDHPTAKFESTSITKEDKGIKITGNLTLLGKTKEISFPATVTHGDTLTLKADFKIDRTKFGMTYGEGKVDNEVSIMVSVDAKKN